MLKSGLIDIAGNAWVVAAISEKKAVGCIIFKNTFSNVLFLL